MYGCIMTPSTSVSHSHSHSPRSDSNKAVQVGHDESSLTKDRTLESLYINPILDVLKLQNPSSPFVTSPTNNGVFDTSTSQTLYFFIDLKTSGPETLKAVISALQPLRDQGYLTTLKDNKTLTTGPVTVIGTGNTPLDMVGPVADRDYFYDAPLEALAEPEYADITGLISPIASTNFASAVGPVKGEKLSDEQIEALRQQIQTAEERGIGARYWGTPYYPVRTRNFVWRTLLEEGVALLNADDLDAVVEYF
ncbi:Altered inheritance of mitochondria protein 6 [Aspergillus niger]